MIMLTLIIIIFLLTVIIQKLSIIAKKLENGKGANLIEDIKYLRDKNIISQEELEEKMPMALEIQKKEDLIKDKKAVLNLKKHGLLSNYEFRYKLDLLNTEYDNNENSEK